MVVVAELDLGHADGVILIDDRHAVPLEQGEDGIAGIEITGAIVEITGGQKNLRGVYPVTIEALLVGPHQETLADGRAGLKLAEVAPNVVVKVPVTPDGYAAVAEFGRRDIRTNMTLCFSATQALLAAEAGAEFVDRLDLKGANFDAIVHATPVGMTPNTNSCFFQPAELNARVLFETVYTPATTRLMRLAQRRGLQVISGVEMFLTQAAEQFRLWTRKQPPEKLMEEALRAALPK